jgi:D-inositol-3-phosphate glycosyltransferase
MDRRIAFISEHASPLPQLGGVDAGGQNVYVGQLARHVAALGYDVDIFTRRDSPEAPEIVDLDGPATRASDGSRGRVRLIHISAGPAAFIRKEDLLPYMGEFRDAMLEFIGRGASYQLIHANFFMSALVAAEIKRILGIPFVVTFHALGKVRRLHQAGADGFSDERFAIEERVIAEADQVIAECPQDQEDLIRMYDADPDRLTIVPSGFNPSEFWPMDKARARKKLDLPAQGHIILQLGRMVPRKGVDNVIRGFARLVHQHGGVGADAMLLIVGGETREADPEATPELGRLMRVAEEEGVAGRVRFTGSRDRDELRYYYNAADVFVTTPWYEPFGITPLEAMACGTPVIGANVGGIKFSVRDGESGYLVPPKDPDALAERLAFMFNNPRLMASLRQQSIRRANDLFTWARVADAMAAVYEQVLAAGRPALRHAFDELALIDRGFATLVETLDQSRLLLRSAIMAAADAIINAFQTGGKVLVCGNGGSASDAQHFAGELVGRFKYHDRPGLPAIALTADSAVLTAWGNDVGYDKVFSRQVEAFGRPGDVLIGISTSGRSKNVVEAFHLARRQGLTCISLTGNGGGSLLELSDIALIVPGSNTPRIQEVHILSLHLICEIVDERIIAQRDSGAPLTWDLPLVPDRVQGGPIDGLARS